jgi:hypothetical protein
VDPAVVTRRVIVYDRRRPCPLCGRRRSSLLAEVLAFMWWEIPPRGRLLALWLFGVAVTAPHGTPWLVTGTAGLLGSLALTAAIVGRR